MASKPRMSGLQRRSAIVQAARGIFAEDGFSDASVKEIAKAADVSEALIYKHFPSKEALYKEALEYGRGLTFLGLRDLQRLPPSTESLVRLVYYMVHTILFEVPGRSLEQKSHERLMFRSLVGDPAYAKRHFALLQEPLCGSFVDSCFEASMRAGDMVDMPVSRCNRIWFVHHLAMALNLCHLSGEPAFDYGTSMQELAHQTVLFCLRGLGLTDKAIQRHFQPNKLREFVQHVFAQVTSS